MLTESLITLLLVAIVLPSLLLLVTSLTFSAMVHRRAVAARNIATTVAESIDADDYSASCDPLTAYEDAIEPMPPGYEDPVLAVRYQAVTSAPDPSVGFQSACIPGADQGLQEITVTVTSTGARPVSGSVVLVKRNDECASGAPTALGQRC